MVMRRIYKIIFFNFCLCLIAMDTIAQNEFEDLEYPYPVKHQAVGDDITIAYADEGEGEVILFIHGMGSYAPAWKKNITDLKSNYRCIVVDLPGYGKSSKGEYAAGMNFHADHLFRLMDSLKIEDFHIAGHSMGGQIAMHMALSQPGKVKSLMLMAPAGIETFTDQEKQIFFAMTPEQLAGVTDEQYRFNLELNFYQMPEDAEFMYDDRMKIKEDPAFIDYCHVVIEGIKGMLNEPVFKQLSALKLPVLILYGKEDQLIPNKYMHPELSTDKIAAMAQEQMPLASIHLIEEAGHFVHFEQAEQANNLINEFLKTNQTSIK